MIAQPGRKVLVMGLISTGLVTWRELKQGEVPPPPHAYAGVAIVYGFASVIAELNGTVAVYLAAAWTLGIAYSSVGSLRGPLPGPRALPAPKGKAPVKAPGKAPKAKVPARSTRVASRQLPPRQHRKARNPARRQLPSRRRASIAGR